MGAGALGLTGLTGQSGEACRPPAKGCQRLFRSDDRGQRDCLSVHKFLEDQCTLASAVCALHQPRTAGHGCVDASNHFLYVIFENQTALRLRRGRGTRWLPLVRPRAHRPEAALAALDPASCHARPKPRPSGIHERRQGQSPRPPGPCTFSAMAPIRATGSMEPPNRGRSAPTHRPAVSVCSTRMQSTSTNAAPSARAVLVLKALGAPVINEAAEVDSQ